MSIICGTAAFESELSDMRSNLCGVSGVVFPPDDADLFVLLLLLPTNPESVAERFPGGPHPMQPTNLDRPLEKELIPKTGTIHRLET